MSLIVAIIDSQLRWGQIGKVTFIFNPLDVKDMNGFIFSRVPKWLSLLILLQNVNQTYWNVSSLKNIALCLLLRGWVRSTMKMLALLLPPGHSLKRFVATSFSLCVTEEDRPEEGSDGLVRQDSVHQELAGRAGHWFPVSARSSCSCPPRKFLTVHVQMTTS